MSDEDWDDWGEESEAAAAAGATATADRLSAATADRLAAVVEQLKAFQLNVCDADVIGRLSQRLSSAPAQRFAELQAYCLANEKRCEAQTRADIRRNDYTVHAVLAGGASATTTDAQEVEAMHLLHHQRQSSVAAQRLVWSLASQTLYSELLTAVTKKFLDSNLSLGVISTGTAFVLTLRDSGTCSLSTSSTLRFSTTIATKKGAIEKLELASLDATIDVTVEAAESGKIVGNIKQLLHSPKLCPVFDADLQRAAESILALRAETGTAGGDGDQLEIDLQAKRLAKGVTSSLSRLAKDVKDGLSGISKEVAGDLQPSLAAVSVEGLVRSFGNLVGARAEDDDEPLSAFRREMAERAAAARDGPPQEMSPVEVREINQPEPKKLDAVRGLFDKVAEDQQQQQAQQPAVVGLWGGWSSLLVKGIGSLVQADKQQESDTGDFKFSREDDANPSQPPPPPSTLPSVQPSLSPDFAPRASTVVPADVAAAVVVASDPVEAPAVLPPVVAAEAPTLLLAAPTEAPTATRELVSSAPQPQPQPQPQQPVALRTRPKR